MIDRLIAIAHKVTARVENRLPNLRLKIGSRELLLPSAFNSGVTRWQANWKSQLIKRLLSRSKNPLFLDVGANVGQTLLDFFAADTGGSYFGFEPSPACGAQVQRIINLNNLKNAYLFPLCLLDRADIVTFYRNRHADTDESATTVNDLRPDDMVTKVFVPAFPLDQVAEKQGWLQIDLIKIDVEGAETSVLSGMTSILQTQRPAIMCEVLRADGRADIEAYATVKNELQATLEKSGYEIFNIVKSAQLLFERIEKYNSFPTEVWTYENSQQCDYLFVPQEKVETLGL